MSFDSITNRGEFFSNHYLEAVLASDLGDLRSTWDAAEARGEQTGRSRLKGGAAAFFAARADANEASPSNADDALRRLHNVVLGLLGFEPDRTDLEFKQNTEHLLDVPVAAKVETSTGLLLVAIEAGNAPAVDDLFDFDERQLHTGVDQPGELRHRVFRNVDKRAVHAAADAVGEIYNTDEPPRYVLVLGGSVVLLAERAKWSEGRFLAVDLGLAFDRNDTSAKGELETIAALFSADALVPVDGQSALETLVDKSHKHAVGVSKELRTGIRESIEIIANEVIAQRDARARERNQKLFTRTDVDARDLTRQALRYLYRLIVLLYAESRPELGIVPADDQDYVDGYSLDRLRELCLVDLTDDHARNGSHFQQSLDRLFELVNGGYHADSAEQQLLFAGSRRCQPGRSRAPLHRALHPVPRSRRRALLAGVDEAHQRSAAAQRGAPAGAAQADARAGQATQRCRRVHLLRPARHQPARRRLRGPDGLHRLLRPHRSLRGREGRRPDRRHLDAPG